MAVSKPARHPIIYVRGYAMTKGEILDTTSTPYMGFELGSTKIRQEWDRKVRKLFFESPIVRLGKDYEYADIYRDGVQVESGPLPSASIIIHRYYDRADPDFGDGKVPSIEVAARELSDLILRVRTQVLAGGDVGADEFRVFLVAHSMGGLVCRCFLQNPKAGDELARKCVSKVFTYATPHNGIEMGGMNIPDFLALWDMNNFNRERMRKYLAIKDVTKSASSLDGKFDESRFFCLVGTNSKDYAVAGGASAWLAGEFSDGLVRIENAAVRDAPRAFVHRSHSGPYGIVNSEEGYQNLVRFLFGDVRVDGLLEIVALPLPPLVEKEAKTGLQVKVGYYFEVAVSVRGAIDFDLTRRSKEQQSAIHRMREELVDEKGHVRQEARHPHLFSVFLDSRRRPPRRREMVFTIQIAVSTTSYEVGDTAFSRHQIPGEYLFRNTVLISAIPPDAEGREWTVEYSMIDDRWSSEGGAKATVSQEAFEIPLASEKGFEGRLILRPSVWS